jgi:hypothetical protein
MWSVFFSAAASASKKSTHKSVRDLPSGSEGLGFELFDGELNGLKIDHDLV